MPGTTQKSFAHLFFTFIPDSGHIIIEMEMGTISHIIKVISPIIKKIRMELFFKIYLKSKNRVSL